MTALIATSKSKSALRSSSVGNVYVEVLRLSSSDSLRMTLACLYDCKLQALGF
jgi:hypothetical protein